MRCALSASNSLELAAIASELVEKQRKSYHPQIFHPFAINGFPSNKIQWPGFPQKARK
jgi:hypothetical protein